MHKWLTTLMTVAMTASAPYVGAWQSDATSEVTVGYRQDNSRWSFRGPSEQGCRYRVTDSIDEAHILELGIGARSIIDCNAYVRGHLKMGWVLDGDHSQRFSERVFLGGVTPAEEVPAYCGDVAITKVDSLVDGRYTLDAAIGIGYPFYFCDCSMKLIPVIGYGFREQNYRFEQNELIYLGHGFPGDAADHEIIVADLQNSDSKLVSRWWGPWIGFDLEYNPCACWDLFAQFEWFFPQFKGKRQTKNGIRPFDHFDGGTHDANGFVFRVGTNYELCDCWVGGVQAFYEHWDANKRVRIGCDKEDRCIWFFEGDHYRFKNKNHGFGISATLGTTF